MKKNKERISEKIKPPKNPSILFFGETDLKSGLLPKVTPNTYAAESEIQIKAKKQKTISGLIFIALLWWVQPHCQARDPFGQLSAERSHAKLFRPA